MRAGTRREGGEQDGVRTVAGGRIGVMALAWRCGFEVEGGRSVDGDKYERRMWKREGESELQCWW